MLPNGGNSWHEVIDIDETASKIKSLVMTPNLSGLLIRSRNAGWVNPRIMLVNYYKETFIMNKLLQTYNQYVKLYDNVTVSDKGAFAYKSSLDKVVDLYMSMGALRIQQQEFIRLLFDAWKQDPIYTLACVFKLRDIRGGMGERSLTRLAIKGMEDLGLVYSEELILEFIRYGRVDDLFILDKKDNVDTLVSVLESIITGKDNQDLTHYVAKWLPRKPKTPELKRLMSKLRSKLQYTPKQLRQWMSNTAHTTEKLISAKLWNLVDYNTVPSQAMRKLNKAFLRNDEGRYLEYVEALAEKRENVKVNAGTLLPYQVMNRDLLRDDDTALKLKQAQWESLPDYFAGLEHKPRILPMVDVSGSMSVEIAGNTTAMDVAISLGAYLSQRIDGEFKNHFLTFSETPTIVSIEGITCIEKIYNKINDSNWGMSTDIYKAFELILELAKTGNVKDNDMPEYLLILSDMNFDAAMRKSYTEGTLRHRYEPRFAELGLKMPKIVYWNLDHNGTFQCMAKDEDVCGVSGFSPSILLDVLTNIGNMTPESVMLNGVDKYIPSYPVVIDPTR